MTNSYDAIARVYVALSRIIFGNAISRSQEAILNFIKPNSTLLIVGGGTGAILESIAKLHPLGLKIVYVEKSSQMMQLAKSRDYKNNTVDFVELPIENFTTHIQFDLIFTPFVLDNFREPSLGQILISLDNLLKKGGLWLYVDFNINKSKAPIWQWPLLFSMYLFFKVTSNLETMKLVDVNPFFAKHGFIELNRFFFYKRFIVARVYLKPNQ